MMLIIIETFSGNRMKSQFVMRESSRIYIRPSRNSTWNPARIFSVNIQLNYQNFDVLIR